MGSCEMELARSGDAMLFILAVVGGIAAFGRSGGDSDISYGRCIGLGPDYRKGLRVIGWVWLSMLALSVIIHMVRGGEDIIYGGAITIAGLWGIGQIVLTVFAYGCGVGFAQGERHRTAKMSE